MFSFKRKVIITIVSLLLLVLIIWIFWSSDLEIKQNNISLESLSETEEDMARLGSEGEVLVFDEEKQEEVPLKTASMPL
jgi:hypothetical protein